MISKTILHYKIIDKLSGGKTESSFLLSNFIRVKLV